MARAGDADALARPPAPAVLRAPLDRDRRARGRRGGAQHPEERHRATAADAGLLQEQRRRVGAVGRLLLAAQQLETALERAPRELRVRLDAVGGVGRVVDEQELAQRADVLVARGDVLRLVQPRRLLREARRERVGPRLVAVLGEVQRHAARGLHLLPVAQVDAPQLAAEVGEVGHRHPVVDVRLARRRREHVVGVMGEAGGVKQAGVLGDERRRVVGAAADRRRRALEDVEVVVEAVQLADEAQRVDRARDAAVLARALRRGLADEDRVRAVAGVGERLPAGLHERAVDRRRGLDLALGVARVRRPLRGQPAGLVGLVPDRPVVDARQPVVRTAVALADRLDEEAELGRVGAPVLLQVLAVGGRLGGGPARDRRRDVEVHEDPARQRALDEVVVVLPDGRLVVGGIARVAGRLRDRRVRRGELLPEDRDADPVDAERCERVERLVLRRRIAVDEQRVVLEHRLLGRRRRGRRRQCRQHEGGQDEGEESFHLVEARVAAICLRASRNTPSGREERGSR